MEGIWEMFARWATSASGSGMLMGVASTTLGILLATFIRTKIWPLTVFFAKCVLQLAGLVAQLVLTRIFQRTDVELQEHDGGEAPCKAQVDDV